MIQFWLDMKIAARNQAASNGRWWAPSLERFRATDTHLKWFIRNHPEWATLLNGVNVSTMTPAHLYLFAHWQDRNTSWYDQVLLVLAIPAAGRSSREDSNKNSGEDSDRGSEDEF